MELLVPGLILVALMVYASTRIKRTAAAAFDAEAIETDEYVIQKPEGFLHNLSASPEYLFEAYSKEFSKEMPAIRVGRATITRSRSVPVDDVIEELHNEGLVDKGSEVLDELQYRHLSIEGSGVDVERHIKLCETKGAVYKLEVAASKDGSNEPWIETFMDTFRVK